MPPPKDRARRRHPCRETRPITTTGVAEDFLYEEAELLDARDYGAWLARLSDDHLLHADEAQREVGRTCRSRTYARGAGYQLVRGGQVDPYQAGRAN